MATAKRIPSPEYSVQLTMSRTEARLVHKVLGQTVSWKGIASGPYSALTAALGDYRMSELRRHPSSNTIIEDKDDINKGYPEE